jgi:Holliday junction resolvase RusA-like endonuclease
MQTGEIARFFVPGIPQPGGSKRAFVPKGWKRAIITDANAKAKPWQQTVKVFARDSYAGVPSRNPLSVEATFMVQRPRGHFGTGRNAGKLKASAPTHPTGKPDATKLWRSTEDALTGILWADDAQIVRQSIGKAYSDRPGVQIAVYELGGEA